MLDATFHEEKGRLVIGFDGDLKSTNVEEARQWLDAEWPRFSSRVGLKQVYLDVRKARVIDSVGMNWIFMLLSACGERHVGLTIQVASPAAMRVFEFSGLPKLATIKFRRRKQL